MPIRLKTMFALARLGYNAEEYCALADLVVWTAEQPGETRGWITITSDLVERYEAAKEVMAT